MPWAYVFGVREQAGRVKIGAVKKKARTTQRRMADLQKNNADTIYEVWRHELPTTQEALELEAAIQAIYAPYHLRSEWYRLPTDEVERIMADSAYLLRRVEEARRGQPLTIEDCLKKGLVRIEVLVYVHYPNGRRMFDEEMRVHRVSIPESHIKTNIAATPRGPWSGKVTIMGWNGQRPSPETRKILQACSPDSEVKKNSAKIWVWSQEAVRVIGHMLFPRQDDRA